MRCQACGHGKHAQCESPGRCTACWCAYPGAPDRLRPVSIECTGSVWAAYLATAEEEEYVIPFIGEEDAG